MGIRHGRTHDSPGFRYAVLEELRKGHWYRRTGLSHHSLVSKRIHRRARTIPDQGASSAIPPTLGGTRLFFLHLIGRSYTTGTSSLLLFVAVSFSVQFVAWLVVDQCSIFRNHRYDIVDGGADGDVYPVGAARCGLMVDWMVRRGFRLKHSRTLHDSSYSQYSWYLNALFYS